MKNESISHGEGGYKFKFDHSVPIIGRPTFFGPRTYNNKSADTTCSSELIKTFFRKDIKILARRNVVELRHLRQY